MNHAETSNCSVLGHIFNNILYHAKKRRKKRLSSYVGLTLADSLGYKESFEAMFESLGLEMTPITREQCLRWDNRRKYLSDYKKQPKAKETRNRVKLKLARDNAKAMTYKSGMAGPQVGGKVGGSYTNVCKTCGEKGQK
jgi:hypothetical protein